jgi:ribosomal protein S18 acetylase RimI-like enzyme
MSASSDPDLLARLVAFVLSLERDASEIVEQFDWGRLVYNPKTAAMWSGNYLEVHSAERDAGALAELADEVLAPRGIEHRFVMPLDPAGGQRLLPGFRELGGWEIWRSVYMVRAREPDCPASEAKEVSRDETEAVRLAVAENDPDLPSEAVEQRLIRDARMDPVGHGRWFAAPRHGEPAASSVLYSRDGIGQVEKVATVPERRGEGLASAVVMAAARASRVAGHRLTFLDADADDWPWRLYERLGFDRVGEHVAFLRKPPQLQR